MGAKGAAQQWLEQAAEAYDGEDTKTLVQRALRFHATLDGMVFQHAILSELKAIRGGWSRTHRPSDEDADHTAPTGLDPPGQRGGHTRDLGNAHGYRMQGLCRPARPHQ